MCTSGYLKKGNYRSSSNEGENDICPAYQEMKTILKTSATNGITIMEARTQHNRLSAERSNATLPHPQRENALNQTLRLEKLEHLICILTSAISPQSTP
jgi:hypothetical protein